MWIGTLDINTVFKHHIIIYSLISNISSSISGLILRLRGPAEFAKSIVYRPTLVLSEMKTIGSDDFNCFTSHKFNTANYPKPLRFLYT